MDEELVEADVPTVGERLRAAREEKGMNLEDIARRLESAASISRALKSPTGTSFRRRPTPSVRQELTRARSGSTAPDQRAAARRDGRSALADRAGRSVRAGRPRAHDAKWLVFGTIAAVIVLIVLMSWLNRRSLDQSDQPATVAAAPAETPASPTPKAPAAVAPAPVAAPAAQERSS